LEFFEFVRLASGEAHVFERIGASDGDGLLIGGG
jgi:hypothetical protein